MSPSVRDETILPRHDLLGEKMLANLSVEKSLEHLFPCAFTGFRLHSKTECICKAHQASVSSSNDQGKEIRLIVNIQRTRRAFSKSGSDR